MSEVTDGAYTLNPKSPRMHQLSTVFELPIELRADQRRKIRPSFNLLVIGLIACSTLSFAQGPFSRDPVSSTHTLKVGNAEIQVDFAEGKFDLPQSTLLQWVDKAARAVTAYYGHFPVPRVRVLIVPTDGSSIHGTTWGDMHGWPAFTRMRVGTHVSQTNLTADWTMTHELTHSAFPSMPDDQHWIEEGLATYVEPIARAQIGDLTVRQVWEGMVTGMPNGEPEAGDQGMDRTHTWGRTYWGGALFCLMADVTIRRETHNRKGLQDALRAIVAAGGTINNDWPLMRALEIGDRATGTSVLENLYNTWSNTPRTVDLAVLWRDLGVQPGSDGVTFNPKAPFASVREAITAPEPHTASAATAPSRKQDMETN